MLCLLVALLAVTAILGGLWVHRLESKVNALESRHSQVASTTSTTAPALALAAYVNRVVGQLQSQVNSLEQQVGGGAPSLTTLNNQIGQIGNELLNFFQCVEGSGSVSTCASQSGPGG